MSFLALTFTDLVIWAVSQTQCFMFLKYKTAITSDCRITVRIYNWVCRMREQSWNHCWYFCFFPLLSNKLTLTTASKQLFQPKSRPQNWAEQVNSNTWLFCAGICDLDFSFLPSGIPESKPGVFDTWAKGWGCSWG